MVDPIPLRSGVLLSDITGQLRAMADSIESGEREATTVLLLIPRDGDWPDIFGWGDHLGDLGNIATMELAKTWFINNVTTRT